MKRDPSIFSRQVFSWSLYDFANTIFSMNILSRYFKPWVVEDLGRDGLYYDIAYSASMLLAGLLMPALGALSDRSGKKKLFLFLFTVTCCLSIGLVPALPSGLFIGALILFASANFFYEGGMVFYNSLLYSVAEGKQARLVSGFGVAMGYFGSIVGLVIMLPFVYGEVFGFDVPGFPGWGKEAAFFPTAVVFLLFSIPLFIWVKEKRFAIPDVGKKAGIRGAYREVWEGIRETKKYPGVLRFLIADYFFEDAVATVILNIGVFSSLALGLKGSDIDAFLIISTVSAMAGSYILGRISQEFNLKAVMSGIVWGWIVTLLLFIFVKNIIIIYILGSVIGILLGGLWTVSRPLLAERVPRAELGRFFGLYALSGRAAAIVGPVLWGTIVYIFDPSRPAGRALIDFLGLSKSAEVRLPYQLAIVSLVLLMIIGLYIFRKVPRTEHGKVVGDE